jgi:hypothetical protein
LVDAEKEIGFAGGVRFDERGKVKAGEDRGGEKVGGDFNKLGLGKGSTEVVVGQVNRPEEGVARHDRVKEKIHAGERSYVGGGGARGLEAVTASGTANATVQSGAETSEGAWEKEGGRRPLLFGYGVKVGGGGGGKVDGAEGASGLDQLHQFGVAGEKPL